MSAWHPIITDKIEQLMFLIDRIEIEYPKKKELSKVNFTEYLQNTCSEIKTCLNSVYDYLETTNLKPSAFEILKRKCEILIEKEHLLEYELEKQGRLFDDFYIDVDYLLRDKNSIQNSNRLQYDELIKYINEIKLNLSQTKILFPRDKPKTKKGSEKWYALLYWVELKSNGLEAPINNEGNFIKSEIEEIGRIKTGTTGQSFYRKFREIDLTKPELIKKTFGAQWKNKIIELADRNDLIINYIEQNF